MHLRSWLRKDNCNKNICIYWYYIYILKEKKIIIIDIIILFGFINNFVMLKLKKERKKKIKGSSILIACLWKVVLKNLEDLNDEFLPSRVNWFQP